MYIHLTMMCIAVIVCMVLSALTVTHQANTCTGFTICPSSQVVGLGQQAVFRCLYPAAPAIVWKRNETPVADSPSDGIKIGMTRDENEAIVEYTLTITAQSTYNDSEIVCMAVVENEETPPVSLIIQGRLSMVTDITRNISTITWVPPFSLDLTGVDPDIVYCVEVYNITCGVDDRVVDECNVTEPRYVESRLRQGFIYCITVTPRSNGQRLLNGTNATKEEMFTFLTDPRISTTFASRPTMVTAIIEFRNEVTGVEPASYSLSLTSIDGIEELSNNITLPTSFTRDTSSTTLNVSQPLPRGRLWDCQILALGCNQHPITNLFEFSSHDFQNINVSSSSPREVSVTGDFISGSSAIGILIIVYSATNESSIHYHFIPRSDMPMTTMSNLPDGQYKVSVFVVEENGLPFNKSSTTPRNVSLVKGGDVQSFFGSELHPTSTSICINCTFQDDSATGCVAVVHERISQLSSSGLMNIESSHKFNRSGDTAYGCIKGVNLTDYQIGVFRLVEVMTTVPPSQGRGLDVGLIVSIVVVVVFVIAILIFATILIICCKKRLLSLIQAIREHCQQMNQKKSRDSSTMQRLTTDSSTPQAQDEAAYDVLHRGPAKPSPATTKEEGAFESAAVYNVLDKHPPQSGLIYSSINLGPPSSTIGHDDLHKTMTQYSTLDQQEPQEESSFNEGAAAGNADNRNAGTALDDLTLGFNDKSVLNSFRFIQDHVVPSELTSYPDEDCIVGEDDCTCLLRGIARTSQNSITNWRDTLQVLQYSYSSHLNQSRLLSPTVLVWDQQECIRVRNNKK